MNAVDMAQRAYGASAAPVRTNRGTEYAVFARVTRNLIDARTRAREDFASLSRALFENRRLWTALAVDVAQDGNSLPRHVRAQIFYLSEFVEQQSRKVLNGKASVDALIDVNTAIMRGLCKENGQS